MKIADVKDYVAGKPPSCRMTAKPSVVTTPSETTVIVTMKGLQKPKTIKLEIKPEPVKLCCQVFYHRPRGTNHWEANLAVFPKRLCKVSMQYLAELHALAIM